MKPIVLPFTCKQLEKFAYGVLRVLKWSALIGLLVLIGIGVYHNDVSLIFTGGVFGGIVWFMAIVSWVSNGKLKCKCETDSESSKA